MSFLYPAFLFAIGAVAIPIIIHLFNFRRYKTVYFTNVRFLREVKEKTDSRSRLKHLLILLCRILAIIFLVMAFAQPYIKSKTTPVAVGKKAVSIFIDNSFSMGQLAADVPLLEQAKLKAKEIVSAYGPDDLFQLLTEDFEGRHQRLVDKDEMINLIREVKPSSKTQKISDVISRQKESLSGSGAAQKILFLLSDFQKNFSDFSSLKIDTLFQINLVPLRAPEANNLYIDTCWMESPVQIEGQPNKLFVKINNDGHESLDNGRLTLKVNNETKAISDFSVGAGETVLDTLSYTITDKGWNRAELSIIDHPVSFDDTYYFTYPVAQHVNVMVINESLPNPYLDALFGANQFFVVQQVPFNQLNYADLSKQQFVILNGLKQISSGLSAELKKFVDHGGNLLIFPDATSDLNSYNSFLQIVNADLLNTFSNQKKNVSYINSRDIVFSDVFQRIPQNLSLPQSTGSYSLTQRTNTNADPLMRTTDGAPFMVKYNAGNGIFYLSVVPLDKSYTDLPLNPIFAPMMYKMAISKETSPSNAFVIGKNNQVTVQADPSKADQVLHLKGQTQEFIPSQRLIGNEMILNLNSEIDQSGIYSLADPAGDVQSYVAMNYDRKESDLSVLSNDELSKASKPLKIKVIQNPNRDLGGVITGQNFGLPLWKVSVIFVLIFIALEIALLKFWK